MHTVASAISLAFQSCSICKKNSRACSLDQQNIVYITHVSISVQRQNISSRRNRKWRVKATELSKRPNQIAAFCNNKNNAEISRNNFFKNVFLLKCWVWSGAKVCTSCRAWQCCQTQIFLKNQKFSFDRAENEPAKNLQKFAKTS